MVAFSRDRLPGATGSAQRKYRSGRKCMVRTLKLLKTFVLSQECASAPEI